eukprot:CAMPEP_0206200006 /NCGR_PEP_ID=MMETSP0166-20121206/10610_1 /ASSEMBLY_ACC=CAM_ASM_000260 /TAXON_ID=95228 /ORGANISM="Vannella robusta, Strain DIVA3 518/3/11/1/6" /LENGTH=547 /DNA_ID=CAMNT_0053618237 /DNA_START=48 /DNA_END=1689 /DNA_ORIENTATION=+
MLRDIGVTEETLATITKLFKNHLGQSQLLSHSNGMLWLEQIHVPEYLRSHYWRAFSIGSSHKEGIDFFQFVIAACAANPQTPHAGIWRHIRNYYIFSAFDINQKSSLDAVEFRLMVHSILRLKGKSFHADQVTEATRKAAKKIGGEKRSTLSREDWTTAEEKGKFSGCSHLFRISSPLTEDNFSTEANQDTNGYVVIHHNAIEYSKVFNTPDLRQSISHPEATRKKITTVSSRLLQHKEYEDQNSINLSALVKNVIKKVLVQDDDTHPQWLRAKFSLLTIEQLHQLCLGTQAILANEKNCVQISPPVRVFGDIHGQLNELLVLFRTFGSPNHYEEMLNSSFNGDFVDRGPHSLEVISLLFCLKVAYPHKIFLLRGNHEDPNVNGKYGFYKECVERLGEECGKAIWNLFNQVFAYLPLAGVIGERILCVHGGIGGTLETIGQLDSITKPIVDIGSSALLTDLLWSDPAETDEILGVHANPRGKSIVSFGSDRVKRFCEQNDIDLIIRSHQCIPHGYEFFSSGHLITVFSATNYQNKRNDGAFLEISVS